MLTKSPMTPRCQINVLSKSTSGLKVDSEVLVEALKDYGFDTRIVWTNVSRFGRIRSLLNAMIRRKLSRSDKISINIFSEDILSRWLPQADYNILIPNQEWSRPKTQNLLGRVDSVFCKTRYAESIYRKYAKIAFIGFSSKDCYNPAVQKDYNRYLHVAGQSLQKGTGTLALVWSAHPEWPTLNIVTKSPWNLKPFESKNIKVWSNLTHSELKTLQNGCGVHLCPSEAEGYGHVISEAMSCGALVLTTDAPPMNELIDNSRGLLVGYAGRKPQSLGMNYYVDEQKLEQMIKYILTMPLNERSDLGVAARQWFMQNRLDFAKRLSRELETLASIIKAPIL